MKDKWIPFFKTGTHKDSKGRESSWPEAKIDLAVNHFNSLPKEEKEKRPITVSHPDNNLPVMGYVEKLKRVGDTLYALPGKVAEAFKALVNDGQLPERSMSFHADGTVNHFGFLPKGQPAAVQGLGTFNFSAEETTTTFSFSEGKVLEEEATDENFALKIAGLEGKIEALTKLIEAGKGTAEQKTEFEKQAIEFNKQIASMKAAQATMSFMATLGEKISPAQKTLAGKIYEFCAASKSGDKFEFADGSKDDPCALLTQLVGLIDNSLSFSEFAKKKDHAQETKDIASDVQKAADYIKANSK